MRAPAAWLVLAALLVCGDASAQERKAYKYVDEKGNVVYSQTPPAGKDAKQINIAPASSSRGGSTSLNPYDDPRTYSGDQQRGAYEQRAQEQQKKLDEAKQKKLAELEAECNRNRGSDCKNPETLRLIESNRIPRSRY